MPGSRKMDEEATRPLQFACELAVPLRVSQVRVQSPLRCGHRQAQDCKKCELREHIKRRLRRRVLKKVQQRAETICRNNVRTSSVQKKRLLSIIELKNAVEGLDMQTFTYTTAEFKAKRQLATCNSNNATKPEATPEDSETSSEETKCPASDTKMELQRQKMHKVMEYMKKHYNGKPRSQSLQNMRERSAKSEDKKPPVKMSPISTTPSRIPRITRDRDSRKMPLRKYEMKKTPNSTGTKRKFVKTRRHLTNDRRRQNREVLGKELTAEGMKAEEAVVLTASDDLAELLEANVQDEEEVFELADLRQVETASYCSEIVLGDISKSFRCQNTAVCVFKPVTCSLDKMTADVNEVKTAKKKKWKAGRMRKNFVAKLKRKKRSPCAKKKKKLAASAFTKKVTNIFSTLTPNTAKSAADYSYYSQKTAVALPADGSSAEEAQAATKDSKDTTQSFSSRQFFQEPATPATLMRRFVDRSPREKTKSLSLSPVRSFKLCNFYEGEEALKRMQKVKKPTFTEKMNSLIKSKTETLRKTFICVQKRMKKKLNKTISAASPTTSDYQQPPAVQQNNNYSNTVLFRTRSSSTFTRYTTPYTDDVSAVEERLIGVDDIQTYTNYSVPIFKLSPDYIEDSPPFQERLTFLKTSNSDPGKYTPSPNDRSSHYTTQQPLTDMTASPNTLDIIQAFSNSSTPSSAAECLTHRHEDVTYDAVTLKEVRSEQVFLIYEHKESDSSSSGSMTLSNLSTQLETPNVNANNLTPRAEKMSTTTSSIFICSSCQKTEMCETPVEELKNRFLSLYQGGDFRKPFHRIYDASLAQPFHRNQIIQSSLHMLGHISKTYKPAYKVY